MAKLVECVPNFSEGRDKQKVEKIVDGARKIDKVKILDYSMDEDHNRSVITMIGDPESIKKAVINMAKTAIDLIDMKNHKGEHPRMGAVDVVPFTPVSDMSMDECIELSKEVAKEISNMGVAVYLYEESATREERKNLADIRRGEYEGFFEKIKDKDWKPDFGEAVMNEKSGVTAVGARMPLIAFNVYLDTDDVEIAKNIARNVRFSGGGLRAVKAIGLEIHETKKVQVSMNLVNFEMTSMYQALEMVRFEAKRYGVNVINSEIIGTVPLKAITDSLKYYMQIKDFDVNQVMEKRLLD